MSPEANRKGEFQLFPKGGDTFNAVRTVASMDLTIWSRSPVEDPQKR